MSTQEIPHWLDRYANNAHAWTFSISDNGQCHFKRPLGLVETSFDTDGIYYGGRADITAIFRLEIRHALSKDDLRKRIATAWTLLRLRHVLLMSRTAKDMPSGKKHFVVDVPTSTEEAVEDVEKSMTWLEDHGFDECIDDLDLKHHALNVGRIIQPSQCLSKLHVLPLMRSAKGGSTYTLRFLIVIAHQISDGLAAYNWFSDFLSILNTPLSAMYSQIATAIQVSELQARLPCAQEDLYPRITGSRARQRWFWAIMRVLRHHVQHTMPRTFANPLRRAKRLTGAIPLPPRYASVFDYTPSVLPPMSTAHIAATLSLAASARLMALCRSIHVSIGAGCFALVALSMMTMHAERDPHGTTAPFPPAMGASFPLNPRPFLASNPPADSCMLAFSEGIVMPFLPLSLPIEARFRLVAKHANRELRVYQKRAREKHTGLGDFDKYSPARLLAAGYMAQIERAEDKLPETKKKGGSTPQGILSANKAKYEATCGVSSVGSLKAYFRPGEHDLGDETKDFVADYRGLNMGVRARENEFLIGSSTDPNGHVGFKVSYDENAISQEVAQKWADTICGLLEPGKAARL
ncbi:hypothetical protein ACEQ8H_000803 [Pleosporales sp. CAS-2024a]